MKETVDRNHTHDDLKMPLIEEANKKEAGIGTDGGYNAAVAHRHGDSNR